MSGNQEDNTQAKEKQEQVIYLQTTLRLTYRSVQDRIALEISPLSIFGSRRIISRFKLWR